MFPKYREIWIPLLRELVHRGGESKPSSRDSTGRTVYEALADYFDLPEQARNAIIPESGRSKWKNMVRWARNDLKKQGYLIAPRRGVWAISERGKEFLQEAAYETASQGSLDADLVIDPSTLLTKQQEAIEIGAEGEEFALQYEKQKLIEQGRRDLARKAKRVSLENVAAGYDILSFTPLGAEKYIEVKTSTLPHSSFEITANELNVAKKYGSKYWLFLITEIGAARAQIEELQDPIQLIQKGELHLTPTKYRVMLMQE